MQMPFYAKPLPKNVKQERFKYMQVRGADSGTNRGYPTSFAFIEPPLHHINKAATRPPLSPPLHSWSLKHGVRGRVPAWKQRASRHEPEWPRRSLSASSRRKCEWLC